MQLHLLDRYKTVNDRCAKLQKLNDTSRAENARLDKAVKELEVKNLALEEEVKGLKEERDRHRDESTRSNEVITEQERLVTGLKDQLLTMAAEAICKTRAKLFKEYLSGKHVDWDSKKMQEEVNLYEEMERFKLQGSPVEEEANEEVDAEWQNDKNVDNVRDPNLPVDDNTQE